MKKALTILCLLVLLGGIGAACGAPEPAALLAGKWKATAASFEFNAFEFVPSEDDPGKGKVNLGMISNLLSGSYEVIPAESKSARDMVKITYSLWMISTTRNWYFTVEDDTLEMQEENSDVVLTFIRDAGTNAGTTG